MATLKDLLPPPTDGFTTEQTPPRPSNLTSTALAVVPSAHPSTAGVSKVVTLPTDGTGAPDYSAIVRQGENASRTVHTSADSLREKPRLHALRPVPSQHEADTTAERTRLALEKVVNGKIVAAKTHNPDVLARKEKPSFVRYTPANTNTAHNSGARQRIIKLVEAPVDPMLPPKFSMTKAPVNPPSPPVPVMHSPERKLTKKDAADWKIPPVVSNWKNNRGYTISLDKRLAAEGRDLQDHSINDRFASFAEAMYSAERTARDDVEKRANIQRQVSIRAKTAKEQELRELADRARRERKGYLGLSEATDTESVAATETTRAGVAPRAPPPIETARQLRDDAPPTPLVPPAPPAPAPGPDAPSFAVPRRKRGSRFSAGPSTDASAPAEPGVDEAAVRRRDELRREMREERDREFRQHSYIREESTAPTLKRSKLSRDQERDLAERVALGQGTGGAVGGGEVQYDQRLFNQDGAHGRGQSSLAGGFGADDAYSLYDKPLFAGGNASSKFLYRPPRNEGEEDAGAGGRRGTADRPFGGRAAAGATAASKGGAVRDRPVEFERDTELKSAANEDPYGLEQFFTQAKKFEKEAKD